MPTIDPGPNDFLTAFALWAVGTDDDGRDVGIDVGFEDDGKAVGIEVGLGDGCDVGTGVGLNVGDDIGFYIKKKINLIM